MGGYPLSNIDIIKLFSEDLYTANIFKGELFPRENRNIFKIIKKVKPPAMYLVNTDLKLKEGMHWLIVYYLETVTIFFDPLGYTPVIYAYPFMAARNNVPVIMNTHNLQSFNTSYCGHYCLVYGLLLARGYSLFDINTKFFFDHKTVLNDSIVNNIIKWLSPKKMK